MNSKSIENKADKQEGPLSEAQKMVASVKEHSDLVAMATEQANAETRFEQFRAMIWHNATLPLRRKLAGKFHKDHDKVIMPEMSPDNLDLSMRGKYIKFAFDNRKLPSMPKAHGRKNPRLKAKGVRIKNLSLLIFRALYEELEEQVKKSLKLTEKFAGLTQDQIKDLGAIAGKKAAERINELGANMRKAKRDRQKVARRVNFGLLAGNRARATHSGG